MEEKISVRQLYAEPMDEKEIDDLFNADLSDDELDRIFFLYEFADELLMDEVSDTDYREDELQ